MPVRNHPRSPAIWPFFFVSGAVLGTWSADIPAVRGHLGLSTAAMSALILLMGVATVSSGLRSGQLLRRLPSARLIRVGALLTPIAGAITIAAPSPAALAIALIAFGATYALLDVSMNAHGVAIEGRTGAAVLSSLHGGWSIGALAGAGAVAIGHLVGLDYRLEAAIFFAALILLGGWFGGGLEVWQYSAEGRAGGERRGLVLPVGSVILIGAVALLLYSVEGVVLDWGSLYVVQDAAGTAALGATAVAGFSAGMAAGRLLGDAAHRSLGRRALLQVGMAVVAASLLLQVVVGVPALAVPVFFLTGVGAANSAPLLLGAAGRSGDMPVGAAIAATTMMGDLGLLFVSPLLGLAAQFSSFSVTLACAGCLAGLGVLGARFIPG